MSDHMDTAVKFVKGLNERLGNENRVFSISPGGRKYIRIVTKDPRHGETGGSVHAFLTRATGTLHKAAGWTGPVTTPRYDISDEDKMVAVLDIADPYGSYLYLR